MKTKVFNEEKERIRGTTTGSGTTKPLVLFSGDFVGPSLTSSITQGTHILNAMNMLGVHYGTWGNHEFDFGIEKLVNIISGKATDDGCEPVHGKSVTTWIASNMNGTNGQPIANAEKQVIVDWNGIKVGILGCSENWLPNCSKIQEFEAIYLDHILEANRICSEMREAGVEVILALTHSRLEQDKEFAKLVPEVDLVLGGHDHFNYLNLDERIVKGGQEWKFLNSIDVVVKRCPGARPKVKCRQIPIFYNIEEDPDARNLEELYENLVNTRMNKVIGTTPVALESTEAYLRFQESELGNFIADVIQQRLRCDLAVIQGFEVAGKYILEAGKVKLADIYSWFAKATTCISVKLTGTELRELFEVGVRSLPGECAGFVHVSKFCRYTGRFLQSNLV